MTGPHPKFIARARAPRVRIDYPVELYGAEQQVSLPFVVGVLADLGGQTLEVRPPLAERKLLEIDVDNFDRRMAAVAPRLAFTVPGALPGQGELAVELRFAAIDDFAPAAVALQVEALAALLQVRRTHLADADGDGAALARIDQQLTARLNPILHHPAFRALEGAWRGLHYLVQNTQSSEMLKIRFMDVGKREVGRSLQQHRGIGWDQGPVFKWLYENEYGSYGGQPFGCVLADYHFDHGPADVAWLADMARICAAAHTPFIAGASLGLVDLAAGQARRRALSSTLLTTPEYAAWRGLRASDESRYIGLALPRFLARPRWGRDGIPVEAFDFQEEIGPGQGEQAVWCNAAYAMGVGITRAFDLYGWCARICGIESGGAIEGLPVQTVPDPEDGWPLKSPVEVVINDRQEADLAACGLMPLVHRRDSGFAAFMGARTLHEPFIDGSTEATANAALAARLPYLLACCRFAQHLKCLVRDRIGSFRSRGEMEAALQGWIARFVDPDPVHSSDASRAQMPLASAEVLVDEVEGNPGYYAARFFLRPHYQLEGLTTSMRIVSRLPASPLATA